MSLANGALPASVLGTIPGTFKQLLSQLVPQTDALRVAFAAHFGRPLVITDAYRDLATQQALKITKGAWAATPGTSNHGWGRAMDLGSGVNVDGSPEFKWMVANAPAYGWTHPAWASDWNPANGQHEPWHWEASTYAVNYPRATTPAITDVPTITLPAPLTPTYVQEDDMARLIRHPNGAIALVGPGAQMRVLHNGTEVDTVRATGQATGDTIQLPDPLIWNTAHNIAARAGTYTD